LNSQTAEVHCHGGLLAPKLILETLRQNGFRIVAGQELWQRQNNNPWQAAAVEAVSQATTLRSADRLLRNADGRWEHAIAEKIVQIERSTELGSVSDELRQWMESLAHAARLIHGWKIAIGGRPNVGKSSLINRLVGFARSIVFDQPGTTRDVVRQPAAIGGMPVQILDTAGLRSADDAIESIGVRAARSTIVSADLAIWVSDISQPWTEEDQWAADHPSKFLLVHNKTDLPQLGGTRPEGIRVSLLHDPQIESILAAIESRIQESQLPSDSLLIVRPWQQDALQRAIAYLEQGDRLAARQILANPVVDSRTISVG
jgi:tRNA modification GTPase